MNKLSDDKLRRGFELLSDSPEECDVEFAFEAQREVVLGDADQFARVVQCLSARMPKSDRGHEYGDVVESD